MRLGSKKAPIYQKVCGSPQPLRHAADRLAQVEKRLAITYYWAGGRAVVRVGGRGGRQWVAFSGTFAISVVHLRPWPGSLSIMSFTTPCFYLRSRPIKSRAGGGVVYARYAVSNNHRARSSTGPAEQGLLMILARRQPRQNSSTLVGVVV